MRDNDLSTILMLCAGTLCFVAGALVWRHVTIASGVLILAGGMALAAGWFMHDATSESASTRGTAGTWSPRARAMLAQASRLRDSDAPVSHARAIDRINRLSRTANSVEGSAS